MTAVNSNDLNKLRRELTFMLHHPTDYEAIFCYNDRFYRIQSVHTATNLIQLMETTKQGVPISTNNAHHSVIQLPLNTFKKDAQVVYSDDI